MKRYITIMLLAWAMGGCTTMVKPGGLLYGPTQENKLARATRLMEQGKSTAAAELLIAVCSETGVPGVTDEALFRLGLIRLAAGQTGPAQHDMERVRKEYPHGPWAPMATSVSEFLSATEDLRQQGKKLTKENKELRQSIDQLKSLELELGRGGKR